MRPPTAPSTPDLTEVVTLRRERDRAVDRARELEHELGALRGQLRRLELELWWRDEIRRGWAFARRRWWAWRRR